MVNEDHLRARIYQQLEARRGDLVSAYHQALNETVFNSRSRIRPAMLARIASDEVNALLSFTSAAQSTIPLERGWQLCDLGLGEESVFRLGQAARQQCLSSFDDSLLASTLETIDEYQSALMHAFLQRREEVLLQEQEQIRSALEKTLGRYTMQMELAAQVAKATTSILDLDKLLETTVNLIRTSFELYYVGLFLVDEYRRWAILRAGTDAVGQALVRRGYKLELGGDTPVGWCLRDGEPRIVQDVGAHAVRFDYPLLPETHSEIVLPLTARGQIIGAMTVQSKRVAAFVQQDVTALRVISDQLANAIENARLFAQAQANLEAAEAARGNYLHQARKQSEPRPAGYLYQLNSDAFSPADDGWRQEAELALAEPRLAPASRETTWPAPATFTVPITLRDQKIGAIDLYDVTRPGAWSEEDIAIATTVAAQTALALENAQSYAAAQQELAERRRAEEEVKASLREKEVMLKEIHHRVKNNLQVVASLLNLQAGTIKDPKVVEALRESQSRVRSMALIHEKLYQSKDLAHVDFDGYVRNLCSYLFRSYAVNADRVGFRVDVHDVFLGIDRAIPCGLIINELVSNSLKYAFPEGRRGQVQVELHPENQHEVALRVCDDGVGLAPQFDFRNMESLGLQLVNTLTNQLSGIIELDRRGGTAFRIIFPNYPER
jgi:two-component sensor histidine kinase/GAF domain-containing protein